MKVNDESIQLFIKLILKMEIFYFSLVLILSIAIGYKYEITKGINAFILFGFLVQVIIVISYYPYFKVLWKHRRELFK